MAKNMASGLLLALAPSSKKSKKMMDQDDGAEDDDGDGKVAAAEDAIAALEAGDASALSEALTAHYELCAASKKKPMMDY